jgi:hypothetical protein
MLNGDTTLLFSILSTASSLNICLAKAQILLIAGIVDCR